MPDPDQIPTFNLKVVVQETDLKPDTLRAWERRYGLPQPERTAGGHRLYSQHDIDTLKWLVARQHEGMSISRAVNLWRQLEAEGQDPLHSTLSAPSAISSTFARPEAGDTLTELRAAWVSACLAFGELGAEHALSQAFALYPVETVCLDVLQAGLSSIGQGWYEGEISVQQEHFASEMAIRKLEALVAASPAPIRSGLVLIGCPPEEEHTFSPLLLTLFLRRRGWNVVYLGANVPAARLQATLDSVKSNLVILAAQQLPAVSRMLEMGQIFQSAQVPLAFGGLIFNRLPALRAHIPGYFLGERLEHAVAWTEKCLSSPGSYPAAAAAKAAGEVHQLALAHLRERQGLIEAAVWQVLRQVEPDLFPHYLANGNKHIARYIEAALTLGDLSFLDPDIAWVEELLGHYRLSNELLARYLQAYYEAAKTHLDERAQVLVEYLQELSEEKRQA